MKILDEALTTLDGSIKAAQREQVVITRNGKPVALVLSVKGKDLRQLELEHSQEFWEMISERRQQETIGRDELERRLKAARQRTKRAKP